MNKLIAATVAATMALTAVAVSTPKAEARDRTGAAIAAGVVGLAAGAIIGGAIADNQERRRQKKLRAYQEQQYYGYGYQQPQYYEPEPAYQPQYYPQPSYGYGYRQPAPRPVHSNPYGQDYYGTYQREYVCWKGYDYDDNGRRVFKKECGYR